MALTRLDVYGFRNLADQRVNLAAGRNVFFGENGSGKTSVLEAVHCLLTGKSFRGARAEQMLRHGDSKFTFYGEVACGQGAGADDTEGRPYFGGASPLPSPFLRPIRSVGMQRQVRERALALQLDGRPANTIADIACVQPVTTIDPATLDLLSGPSLRRRQVLDWGVFHVERCTPSLWQRYNRALEQRNQLLRSGRMDAAQLQAWSLELERQGDVLTQHRQQYVERLAPLFTDVVQRLSRGKLEVKLRFHPGWDARRPLTEVLSEAAAVERSQGFTAHGPHRADLKVAVDQRKAATVLSRGQTKVVVVALKLAQGMLVDRVIQGQVLYLIDDLYSELDEQHRMQIGAMLAEFSNQVLFTCIDPPGREIDALLGIDSGDGGSKSGKVFHVEHGKISEIR